MILEQFRAPSFLFFKNKKIIIVSNQGEGGVSHSLSNFYNTSNINEKVKGTEIVKASDFLALREKLNHLDKNLLRAIELAAFKSFLNKYSFFTTGITQIPRPMHLVFKNHYFEVFVLSLDAKSFEKAVEVNERIKKEIPSLKEVSPETILEKIKEILTTSTLNLDFHLKLGVHFFLEKNVERISNLIEKFELIYLEAPLSDEGFKTLTEKHKVSTFLVKHINTLTEAETISSNAALLSYNSLSELDALVKLLKEKNINLFYNLKKDEEELAVALGIPIVKIEDPSVVKKLLEIKEELLRK